MANLISIPEHAHKQRSADIEIKNALFQAKQRLDNDFSGVHRVSGNTTSVSIVFADINLPDQVDDDYTIILTPIDFSGSPPDYAFVINEATPNTANMSIRIDTAPGVGNWVDWQWKIFRWV